MPLLETGAGGAGRTTQEGRLRPVKLYRSSVHPHRWIVHIQGSGWMMFPARHNGWEERGPARGLDPLYLREVPLRLASDTGLPQSEESLDFAEVA